MTSARSGAALGSSGPRLAFRATAWDDTVENLTASGEGEKKADVAEHFEVFRHVGILVKEPPGTAELPFI
jgi:hypothetical protein